MLERARAEWLMRALARLAEQPRIFQARFDSEARKVMANLQLSFDFEHPRISGRTVRAPVFIPLPASFPLQPPVMFSLYAEGLTKHGRPLPGSSSAEEGWILYRLDYLGWSPNCTDIDSGDHLVHLFRQAERILGRL